MSDEEKERFEITDYDLDNEFNINRRQRRPTKHQQIYGIWADDSDNEDEARPSFGNKNRSKDYTAPIGFVAGGVQQAGKKKKEVAIEDHQSDNEQPSTSKQDSDSDSEPEIAPRIGFGAGKKRPQDYGTQSTVTEITGDIAGMRASTNRSSKYLQNQGVGNWEKHTKGIGAKLLLQMGFEPGKGLGKDLQGISAPVEAHLRKGRGAIGAYGPEKKVTIAKLDKEQILDDRMKVEEGNERSTKWRKEDAKAGGAKTKGKKNTTTTRYYYRSVDDVIEKGKRPGAYRNAGMTSNLGNVKVIDMTGPQQRVLSGYHALTSLKAPPGVEHFEDVVHKKCTNFALPEIQHNLDVLVDLCEQDIIRIDRSTRYNQDRIVALEQEQSSLNVAIIKDRNTAEKLDKVLQIVNQLADTSLGLSLGQVAQIFNDLQADHPDEYQQYQLRHLAPGLVGPLITSALASWQPLKQPELYLDIFLQWQLLLASPERSRLADFEGKRRDKIQPYDSLVWSAWVPVIRTCIGSWSPRNCDPLITLLETWKSQLADWLLNNVFDQLVIPKIVEEVTLWDPLTDTVPIHTWIHPWIPLLDTKLHGQVYGSITEKLGTALNNWNPSDPSAKLVLKPWQRALPEGAFVGFVLKHIVPKLQLCMQSFQINPHQQHLDSWNWVMDWNDMLSVGNMTLILDKFFFPRWLQTLAMWLNHNPDYTQVTDWYSGWKRMMPEALLQQPSIKENFHKALEMMNRAVKTGFQPGAKESVGYLTKIEGSCEPPPPPPPPPRIESIAQAARTASNIPAGFKDLISKKCEERGILFAPIPYKYHEARQVYRLGANGTQCYVDRNVVFYSRNNGSWLPTSLARLLDMA